MAKTLVQVLNSPTELFEYARWDWANDSKLSNKGHSLYILDTTDKGSDFNGKQEDVYNKFIKHKVDKEASLMSSIIGDIKSLDFDEIKWKFAQRLSEGDSIDINRYLDGQERYWCGVKRQQTQKKVVRIYSSYGGNCGRSKQELAVSGALAVTLCEILESMGIGVELWGAVNVHSIGSGYEDILQLVKIKDSSEFADLGIINYITGDNHVFRNTVFRTWCRVLSEADIGTVSGLGRHGEITKQLIEGYDDGTSNGIIVIPSIYEIKEAKKWLIDQINTLKQSIK